MKNIVRSMLVVFLMIGGAPAFSDSVMEIIKCQQAKGVSEEDIEKAAAQVLKSLKGMEGGEDISIHLQYPLVAQMGDYDFFVAIVFPSAELWGKLMDGHSGTDAMVDAEEKFFELAACPDSAMFETVDIK
jgi:hypothetical protein